MLVEFGVSIQEHFEQLQNIKCGLPVQQSEEEEKKQTVQETAHDRVKNIDDLMAIPEVTQRDFLEAAS